MSLQKIITVGFDRNGEVDFGIDCSVTDLSYEKYKEIREMTCVAIGVMERMWGERSPHPTTDSVIQKSL